VASHLSERKRQNEDSSRANADRTKVHHSLDTLLESIRDYAIFTLDRSGRITSWNSGARQVTGYSAQEAIGQNVSIFYPPEDSAIPEQEMAAALARGRSEDDGWRLRKDGIRIWVNEVMTPLYGEDGTFLGFTKIARDLTERRRNEQALRNSEERLRLLIESAFDFAIFTLDAQGRIDRWNAGAERIFGYAEDEALGQHGALVFTPEDRARGEPEREMMRARDDGRAIDERWHIRKDGSRFYASGVLTPLRERNGIIGYVKVARDLTQRKETEDALRRAHDELEQRVEERTQQLAAVNASLREHIAARERSDEARNQLLRRLSQAEDDERRRISREMHDQLGQAVTVLQLKVAGLKRLVETSSPEVKDAVDSLQSSAREIDSDVDSLVWQLRPAALDGMPFKDAILEFVDRWSAHCGVAASVHGTGFDAVTLGQDTQSVVFRIVQEALNNIAKHADATRVDIVCAVDGDHMVMMISDDGKGFELNGGAAWKEKGVGIRGMHERAALVGAEVEVDSQPGNGTRISLRVPGTPA
jgi:PAS domain S-box-containing protein